MVKKRKEKPVELLKRGSQRLPDWKFDTSSSHDAVPAFANAMRASRDERLTLQQRRRALAGGLGLSQVEVTKLGLAETLARLDDGVVGVEQVIGSLTLALPRDVLEQLVEQVTARVVERLKTAQDTPPPKMLTVKQAADYMRAKPQRIYDLLAQRKLTRYKDGGRTLLSREEVEAHIRLDAAAITPKK